MFRGAIMAPTLAEIEVCRVALEIHHAAGKAAPPQDLPAHDVCENSRDCIACGARIAPSFGVCFHCHVTQKPILEAQLPNGQYPIPQDLPCGYCSKPLGGRPVCGECWRERTSTLEVAFAEKLAECVRLEKLVLASDGWRCDGCERVFGEDDMSSGEDCDLCESCARQARAGHALKSFAEKLEANQVPLGHEFEQAIPLVAQTPMLTEAEAGEVIANSSQSWRPIPKPRRFPEEVYDSARVAIDASEHPTFRLDNALAIRDLRL
jgi:hypothetical protein